MPPQFATSIVGEWSSEEISASYTPSVGALIAVGLFLLALLGFVAMMRGVQRKQWLTALWLATASIGTYILLVRYLAELLCMTSPLGVRLQGLRAVPFVLGTTGFGFAFLLIFVFSANLIAMKFSAGRMHKTGMMALVDCILISALSMGALIATLAS